MTATGHIADAMRRAAGKKHPFTSAVIVAAGNSTRMGGKVPKQLMELCGMPVLIHTLRAFENAPLVDEIVVVTRASDLTLIKGLIESHRITKLSTVVAGGETRALSVQNGFEAIKAEAQFVAIHDGARCLITPRDIERVCRAAYRHKAATAVSLVSDTVKTVNSRGFIDATLDRRRVALATTPQIFDCNLYRAALHTVKDVALLTDDNQLIERLPFPVRVVDCGKDNIKLTDQSDLARAEFILLQREGKI